MAHNDLSEARLKNGTYGGTVMNANRNPATLYALNIPAQRTLSPELPDDLAKIDLDSFMNRIYALATQV
jgi:hypothetical protein